MFYTHNMLAVTRLHTYNSNGHGGWSTALSQFCKTSCAGVCRKRILFLLKGLVMHSQWDYIAMRSASMLTTTGALGVMLGGSRSHTNAFTPGTKHVQCAVAVQQQSSPAP